MNILFLSIYEIKDSNSGYIYADLVREFAQNGHSVYAVTPTRTEETQFFIDDNKVNIIKVKNGQIQKTGRVKKVINLFLFERNTKKAIKKYAHGVKFDLIIGMSSSLSLAKCAKYFKKRCNATYYLLMKDIFPQNAVDIGMMKKNGVMGIVYHYFRCKEKSLYRKSDYIGCMSNANAEYILKNNPYMPKERITIIPNSIEPIDVSLSLEERNAMRDKYGIPQDKTVFVYGGNLGKPQDIPFVIKCLKTQIENDKAFFLIVGDGTEYHWFEEYLSEFSQRNVKVLRRLPREDFDRMLAACDVGMIFLDDRFTIPNYPSRLLSYMQASLPVLACTDVNTDVGNDIVNGGFGWWCESDNADKFANLVQQSMNCDLCAMGKKSNEYLKRNFTVKVGYEDIINSIGESK